MRAMRHVLLAAGLVLAASARAAGPSTATFVVDETPGFKPVLPALQTYLGTKEPAPGGAQHFCVIGYERGGQKTAWVYWREGQRLVLWEPAGPDFESKDTLTRSRRDLNLRRDVVATKREVGSSSYRIDRPWLNGLLADCRRRGQTFEVR